MKVEVRVPAVGESVQEGMIESWHKSEGASIAADEVLLALETDKATMDIASPATGVLHILVPAGAVVKVGQILAIIDIAVSAHASQTPVISTVASPEPAPLSGAYGLEPGPAVRRVAAEHQLDLTKIPGSGKDGRVTKADALAAVAAPAPATPSPIAVPRAAPTPVPATILGVGRERIEERKPMSMLRRRIAERLIEAQQTAAILTTFNEVDMTQILALRKNYQDLFQKAYGLKLGFMGFFVKASVTALKTFPAVNAYISGTDVCYHNYCDIGVAVSTEKGLMVPVLRDVDLKSIAQIEQDIAAFSVKARENKISLDDLNGGTFTVSNGGVFGSLLSTPILNPPQSAILGMHKTQLRPMVMPDGTIEARPMMYLAMSYDHRIIDGKEAVGFLVKIKEVLEDPARLVLEV